MTTPGYPVPSPDNTEAALSGAGARPANDAAAATNAGPGAVGDGLPQHRPTPAPDYVGRVEPWSRSAVQVRCDGCKNWLSDLAPAYLCRDVEHWVVLCKRCNDFGVGQ